MRASPMSAVQACAVQKWVAARSHKYQVERLVGLLARVAKDGGLPKPVARRRVAKTPAEEKEREQKDGRSRSPTAKDV